MSALPIMIVSEGQVPAAQSLVLDDGKKARYDVISRAEIPIDRQSYFLGRKVLVWLNAADDSQRLATELAPFCLESAWLDNHASK